MSNKEKVRAAYGSILGVLGLKQGLAVEVINLHMQNAAKLHVIAVQFIIAGSGCGTHEFSPGDGDWGNESRKSLQNLYDAACTIDTRPQAS